MPVDIRTAFRTELAGDRNIRTVIHDVCQLPVAHVSLNDATLLKAGTAVAQWLRCCDTIRKVAGSIPAGVIGIFH